MASNFISKTTEARKLYEDIFKKINRKENFQPENLYPVKLYFKNKGNIKTFSD